MPVIVVILSAFCFYNLALKKLSFSLSQIAIVLFKTFEKSHLKNSSYFSLFRNLHKTVFNLKNKQISDEITYELSKSSSKKKP
jgi:hypothetical protein